VSKIEVAVFIFAVVLVVAVIIYDIWFWASGQYWRR
jgi:hypothetical protein